jgi:hypothetical protein
MTASHGPARVEERCAHRSRTSTPPVRSTTEGVGETGVRASPVHKRGYTRLRRAMALRGKVKERADGFRTSPTAVISVAGLGPQPLADALGILCRGAMRLGQLDQEDLSCSAHHRRHIARYCASTAQVYFAGSPNSLSAMRLRMALRSSASAPRSRAFAIARST